MFRKFLPAFALSLSLAGCSTLPAAPPPAEQSLGLVTSADPRAAEAGMEMLRQGGSSTDAALATMFALTVVEPQSSGIGGGGFMVRGTASGEVETFDGRETAPGAATPEWFLDENGKPVGFREAVLSGLSVGVPGNVALAAKAHAEHGRLPWATLFEPAIRLAREGFRMNPRLAESLAGNVDRAGAEPEGQALFYTEMGDVLPVGTLIRREDLARTFERIAEEGPAAFYSGTFAETLALEVASATPHPQGMTAEDIAAYEAKERPSPCGTYRGYRICGMGPPSSGETTVYAILAQLERFDLASMGPDSLTFWQLFVDSQRLAYADRDLYLADSDFVDVPVAGLMDKAYLQRRGAVLVPGKPLGAVEPGRPAGAALALAEGIGPKESGTSHFVAVDRDGTMISYTSTVEGAFGSGLMHGGFYLNNELTDFSFAPRKDGRDVANRVEGGKRPRSSMAPTVIYDPQGQPFAAIGAAGGSTIPVQVARSIIGIIDFDLPLKQALGLPLVFRFGDTLVVEGGSALESRIGEFQAMGYPKVVAGNPPFRAVGAVRRNGVWTGAFDPRLDGKLDAPDEPAQASELDGRSGGA